MRGTNSIHPTYGEEFNCIGPACEDTCCHGWVVPVDQSAYYKLRTLPAGPLRTLIDANILVGSQSENSGAHKFATISMTSSGCCPLLGEDRLCRIQAEVGEAFLPHTCATYPRIVQMVGGIQEKSLALSCPEAARLVLLHQDLLQQQSASAQDVSVHSRTAEDGLTHPGFWPIRNFVVRLVTNRNYPVWQRLFLLGVFCRKLALLQQDLEPDDLQELLRDFESSISSQAPRVEMDALPVNWAAHLDVVLRLAGMMLHTSAIHPRFVECIQAFTTGIGNGPSATFDSLTARFAQAHDQVCGPFLDRHPQILENYLLNAIFRSLFPFGREGVLAAASPSMIGEHTRLTAQFVLMRGLLIGVSGFHGKSFQLEHVVHTIQAASKHFEHHPEFLNQAHALLLASGMEGERGAAILGNVGTVRHQRSTAAST